MKKIGRAYFKEEWPDGLEYILWTWLNTERPPCNDHEKYQLWQAYISARSWPSKSDDHHFEFLTEEEWVLEYNEQWLLENEGG